MVYDWEQHKDGCYDLYITQRKSLEEIMQYMKETFMFAPSKRAFQTQFRKWNFPSKQNPAHRNVDLVSRIKDLWEQNYSQRDMLRALNSEGFEIKERELMRVRAKNRWLLRIPNGAKRTPAEEAFEAQLLSVDQDAIPDEIILKRKERHDQLKAESDERWASKKRRRRTRDYAGIAADPAGIPPRFPSETTLAEGQGYLSLNKLQYRETRDHFQRICEEEQIIKKTLAGAEKWQEAKDRLVQELQYLTEVFSDGQNIPEKVLSLDVICTDVTKRMRTNEKRMTIVDSKMVLKINPEQSRQIRNGFYTILQSNHFTSKLESGHEHWSQLKEEWIARTPLLQEILSAGDQDPEMENKIKALEVLCRDVMKRLRDDQKRKGTSSVDAPAHSPLPTASFDATEFQIDPSLLQASNFEEMATTPTAIYVRPHAKSEIHAGEKMWLAALTTRSVTELHKIITEKWPDSIVARIDGIEKQGSGSEVNYLIEDDEELDAFMEHVATRKTAFSVLLNRRSTG